MSRSSMSFVFLSFLAAGCSGSGLTADLAVGESGKQAIVGGQDAQLGQFDHQVSLQSLGGQHLCGGTLVAPDWVVTAAHCFLPGDGPGTMRVVSGTNDLRSPGEIRGVQQLILHPDWDANTFDSDIALIQLDAPVADGWIPVVGLGGAARLAAGMPATVSGWGVLAEGGTEIPDQLQYIDVPMLDYDTCNDAYGGALTSTMMCAGSFAGGVDACQGDSGGPLVVPAHGGWALGGVVSLGLGCAREGAPGIYTSIPETMDWVASHVAELEVIEDDLDPPSTVPTPEPPSTAGGSHVWIQDALLPGEVDVFAIEVQPGTRIEAWTNSAIDTYATFVDADGNAVASDDDSGDDYNFHVVLDGVAPGTYHLRIRGFSETVSGNYQLVLGTYLSDLSVPEPTPEPTPEQPAVEVFPNAYPVSIDAVNGPSSQAFSVAMVAGSPAYYRLEVAGSSPQTAFAIRTEGEQLDPVVTLFAEDGTLLATDDDGGDGLNADLPWNGPGVYYVEVRDFRNRAGTLGVRFEAWN